MDLLRQKVYNLWILAGYGMACAGHLLETPACSHTAISLFAGACLPLGVLGVFFILRMLGAGDIKVLSVLGAFLGADRILLCMFWSVIFGLIFALGILFGRGIWRRRIQYFVQYISHWIKTGQRQPYRVPEGKEAELHMTVPIAMALVLWIGGLYG